MWQQANKLLSRMWPSWNDARPIFVHGCWRTGSTYVWSKFREDPAYRCYYEPLHEALLEGRSADFERAFSVPGFYKSVGHPQQKQHYFAEYPLRITGGVESFEKRLPYEQYCLEVGQEDKGLTAYVDYLMQHAKQLEQRPMLQFNRGLLRSRWLRNKFNSIDILVLRRPGNVWRSMTAQAMDYYPVKIAYIVGQNRDHRFFAPLAERFQVPCLISKDLNTESQCYRDWAAENESALYALFYYFYALTFLYNIAEADVVLDLDAISESGSVRLVVESQLRKLRIPLNLSDCRPQKHSECEPQQVVQQRQVVELLKEAVLPELSLPAHEIHRVSRFLNQDLQGLLCEFPSSTRRAA